jgi:hypothetical protein
LGETARGDVPNLTFDNLWSNAVTTRSPQELFVLLVPAIAVFAIMVFGNTLAVDGDPFLHIAAGQWMIDNGAFIRSDFYSHTMAGRPLHPHEWLSQVIMAAVYGLAEWHGMFVLLGGAFAATTFILSRALLRYLDPVPALYVLIFALIVLKGWMTMRPHVLAMPILALFADELLVARNENRSPRLWFLCPLMLAWVNLHGSFLFGLALMGPFAVEAVLEPTARKRVAVEWGISILVVAAAAMLNPSGVDGVLYPLLFSMSGDADFPEWRPLVLADDMPSQAALLAGLAAILLLGVRLQSVRLIVLIGMLHIALEHRRFVAVLAIVGALLLAEPLAQALAKRGWSAPPAPKHRGHAAFGAAMAVCLAVAIGGHLRPVSLRESTLVPITALSHVPIDIASRPVFNELSTGGYLIFTGHRIFVDGRADVYGAEFLTNYRKIISPDAEAMESTFAKYHIGWTILPPSNGAVALLDRLPGWCRFYTDDVAVVHVRNCNETHSQPAEGSSARQKVLSLPDNPVRAVRSRVAASVRLRPAIEPARGSFNLPRRKSSVHHS